MVYFDLNLTSSESTFEYSFPRKFLDKSYEIALVKMDGTLEFNNRVNINYTNNKCYYLINGVDQNNNQINKGFRNSRSDCRWIRHVRGFYLKLLLIFLDSTHFKTPKNELFLFVMFRRRRYRIQLIWVWQVINHDFSFFQF